MRKILIVDDERHVLRLMRLALERNGYDVTEAENGEMALQVLAKLTPDVMISDIDMPRMNGEELCKTVNETMPERVFRIYVLTARAEIEHREWSAAIPNLDFMEKPVSIRKLIAKLDEYFSSIQQDEQAEKRVAP